jgi:UDPglucose 6-dehydrogenase
MKVLVVGTGYVGLTTGVALAYLGNQVTCLDIVPEKIAKLKKGKVPIYEPGLPELLELAMQNLQFTTSYDEAGIEDCDVAFIAVGTPSLPDGNADLTYVKAAAEALGTRLNHGFSVIVNKSTVPIGSGNLVETLVRDAYIQRHGAHPDGKYAIASNPEFLRQGSALSDTLYPERVVIGSKDERAIDTLTQLYRPILNQDFPAPAHLPRPDGLSAIPVVTCDLASAELIKYAANSFLALKISYINEIAHLAEKVGANINQIARGIGLDARIGPRFLQAGIGWGGSCFGKDTAALVAISKDYGLAMPIVQAARDVNYGQRTWAVETLMEVLGGLKGKKVTLLGFAFKANTDDLRDTPAIEIAQELIRNGAKVVATDPVALENARRLYPDLGVHYIDDPLEASRGADAVILVTDWSEYRELDWSKLKKEMNRLVILDGRNFFNREQMEKLGFRYIGVGR